MKKFVIIIVLLMITAGCETQDTGDGTGTGSGTVIFSDDFNRTDSTTVGNSWTQVAIGSTTSSIVSNELVLTGMWDTSLTPAEPKAAAVARLLTLSGSFRITINFKIEDNSSLTPSVVYGSSGGYVFFITTLTDDLLPSGGFYITTTGGDAALILETSTSYTFDSTHSYTAVLTKNGSAISITMTDNTDHTSTTASGTSSAYSAFTTFSVVGGGATSGASKSTYVNDVTVESL